LALLAEKRQAIITRAVTKGLDSTVPMKDTDISWLGEIPAHWEVKRLDLLNNPLRPIMYGIVLPGPHFEGGVPIIKGGDVKSDRLLVNRLSRTDPEIDAKHARSRIRAGDIVYAIRGGVGDVELVPRETEGANLTQDAARISPAAHVDKDWLLFALRSNSTLEQAIAGTLGATIRGINIRDLKKIMLPVPPIDEASKIAYFLDAKDQAISRGRSLVNEHISLLQEYKRSLISSAVTGKFDVSKRDPTVLHRGRDEVNCMRLEALEHACEGTIG
jgi:type I restriction enzyme S subunit